MNKAKEIVQAGGKVFIKSLARHLPLGATAVEIYDEIQSKQIERKIKRLEEFYQSLADTINALESKINQEFVNKDDFLDLFEEATRYVVLERQEKKRECYKNILTNSIISPIVDYDKTERYFRLLDNLSDVELSILAVLENPEEYNKKHGMIIEDPRNSVYQFTLNGVDTGGVLTRLLGLRIDDVSEAVTTLFSNGLVVENFLRRTIQTNGNTIHVLDNLLTRKGKDFIKFLEE